MHDFRADFPVFRNHPDLAYLDSTATTQKPQAVIDAVSHYLANDYGNIHRGSYDLAERSEALYVRSKESVARLIGAESPHEIVYSANSTMAFNLLADSVRRSGWLKRGDRILVSAAEHHANVVPWMMLAEDIGAEVEFFGVSADFDIDFADFEAKCTPDVRVVAISLVSNVTGKIADVPRLSRLLGSKSVSGMPFARPLLVVDGSQAVPNFQVDVRALGADFFVFTGHKLYADAGIGVLYGRKELLKAMVPGVGGGGAINFVREDGFEFAGLPYRFEPGTPNLSGAVSLLAAIEYLESAGGYAAVSAVEAPLIDFALAQFAKRASFLQLLGPAAAEGRVGIFSFSVRGMHSVDVADVLGEAGIAVRAGQHCAEPLHRRAGLSGTVRASIGIYTVREELERMFRVLDSLAAR